MITLASAGEERPRRAARFLQLCQTTRTLVTFDERHAPVQAITIGDGWLLARTRGAEAWIDLGEPSRQWKNVDHGSRLRLADERTLVLEEGSESYWLSANGASLTIAAAGIENQRRGWRNLQLRAAKRPEAGLLDVPYLVPAWSGDGAAEDIIFLGPVYFSERMRIGDVVRRNRGSALPIDSLPLLAGGLAASASLAGFQVGSLRDPDLRRRAASIAASDAAAIAAVVNALVLLEVYADRLSKKARRLR